MENDREQQGGGWAYGPDGQKHQAGQIVGPWNNPSPPQGARMSEIKLPEPTSEHYYWEGDPPQRAYYYTTEQVRQAIAQERERADIYRMERDAAREQKEHLLRLLVGIHNLLPPGPIEANGKAYIFNDPNANETLRELRRRIMALEDDLAIRRG